MSAFIFICVLVASNESLTEKAQRVSFPGLTYVNINKLIKNLKLEKVSGSVDTEIHEDLKKHNLKLISSLFVDQNSKIYIAISESAEKQILFTLIKNARVIQIQKINEITARDITLQYGKIILNTQSVASLEPHTENDIF